MKKTKALFAAMIIVVVAAASAGLWYLNENGKLTGEDESQVQTTVGSQDNYENGGNNQNNVNNGGKNETETTTNGTAEETTVAKVDNSDVEKFLSTFSNVYFAENSGTFDINSRSEYDLIMFAYLHIKNTDRSLLGQEKKNDSIVHYTTIAYDDINSVVQKYFGVSVAKNSVFTENDYDFFRYENGYFYTPAADGVGYTNTCKADYISTSGDEITVEFTVYSDSAKYASGEAKIRITDDGMNLLYYSIFF